jgi:tRNA 2-thiouridine synthesizing protein E
VIQADEDGYLTDPSQWTPEWAQEQARVMGLELGDEHWLVLRFMREQYDEHQVAVDARHVMRQLEAAGHASGRKRLFELFPYGYVAQACKIAGMRRPRAWSTG